MEKGVKRQKTCAVINEPPQPSLTRDVVSIIITHCDIYTALACGSVSKLWRQASIMSKAFWCKQIEQCFRIRMVMHPVRIQEARSICVNMSLYGAVVNEQNRNLGQSLINVLLSFPYRQRLAFELIQISLGLHVHISSVNIVSNPAKKMIPPGVKHLPGRLMSISVLTTFESFIFVIDGNTSLIYWKYVGIQLWTIIHPTMFIEKYREYVLSFYA